MIECSEIKHWLVDYVYGELDPRHEPVLNEHLRTCAACRSELAALEKTRTTLDAWPAPATEPGWAFNLNKVPWWSVLQSAWQRGQHRGLRLAIGFAWACMLLITTLAVFNTRLQYENGRWQLSMSLSKPTVADLPAGAVVMTKQQLYEFEVKHLQFMQTFVSQSESRQQQALNKAVAGLARQVDQKRLQDLRVVSAGLEALQDHTATRLAMTDQILTEFIKANYSENLQ
jgi:hypothetical protein